MRHLYLQPLAVGNIKINYAFQSVSDIIIIGEWDWTKDFICARAGVRTEKTEDNTADILLLWGIRLWLTLFIWTEFLCPRGADWIRARCI